MTWIRKTHLALCCAGLWAPALAGCAYTYDDAHGYRHIVGFVDVSIASAKDDETIAGNVVSVTSIGVVASKNAQGHTFALGYTSETTAAIKDNALVLGNPNQAVQRILEGDKP